MASLRLGVQALRQSMHQLEEQLVALAATVARSREVEEPGEA